MNTIPDTNAQIASLLQRQTYDERVALAKYISTSATDWLSDAENLIDGDYFAVLLGAWADDELSEEQP